MKTLLFVVLVASVVIVVAETSGSSKKESLTSVMPNVDEQTSSRVLSTWRDFLDLQELLFKSRGDPNIGAGLALMAMMAITPLVGLYFLLTRLVSALRVGREDPLRRSFISLNTSSLVEGFNEILEKVATALDNMDRKYN